MAIGCERVLQAVDCHGFYPIFIPIS
jgi:hypothetical protein